MKIKQKGWISLLFSFFIFCSSFSSQVIAAEITDVADSFDYKNNNKFDFRFRLTYATFQESGVIAREKGHFPGPGQQYLEYFPELTASYSQHQLILNPVIGLYKDLEFGLRIPLILSSSIETKGSTATNATKSLVNDGIITSADSTSSMGGGGYVLGDISLYIQWSPFNDHRYKDRYWATWVFGFEYTGPMGGIWSESLWDPRKASQEGAVGASTGAHLFKFHTAISKRVHRYVEPYVKVWYRYGVTTNSVNEQFLNKDWVDFHRNFKSTKTDAVLADKENKFHQSYVERAIAEALRPSHAAGFMIGSEFLIWEKPMKNIRINIDLRLFTDAFFDARYFTLTSNALANFSPRVQYTDGSGKLVQEPLRASPITDFEQHYRFGGFWAIHAKVHKMAYIRVSGSFSYTPPFFVTKAKRGVDLADDNGVKDGQVKLGTAEQYPFHVRQLDGIGKRLIQQNTWAWSFQLAAGFTY